MSVSLATVWGVRACRSVWTGYISQAAAKKSAAAIQYGESVPRNRTASVDSGTATSSVTITVLVNIEVAVISSFDPTMKEMDAASAGAKIWPTAANRKMMRNKCQVTCWK